MQVPRCPLQCIENNTLFEWDTQKNPNHNIVILAINQEKMLGTVTHTDWFSNTHSPKSLLENLCFPSFLLTLKRYSCYWKTPRLYYLMKHTFICCLLLSNQWRKELKLHLQGKTPRRMLLYMKLMAGWDQIMSWPWCYQRKPVLDIARMLLHRAFQGNRV